MALLTPQDFAAYADATGEPFASTPAEKAQQAPAVIAWKRSQQQFDPTTPGPSAFDVASGAAALSGIGAATYGLYRHLRSKGLPHETAFQEAEQATAAAGISNNPVPDIIQQKKADGWKESPAIDRAEYQNKAVGARNGPDILADPYTNLVEYDNRGGKVEHNAGGYDIARPGIPPRGRAAFTKEQLQAAIESPDPRQHLGSIIVARHAGNNKEIQRQMRSLDALLEADTRGGRSFYDAFGKLTDEQIAGTRNSENVEGKSRTKSNSTAQTGYRDPKTAPQAQALLYAVEMPERVDGRLTGKTVEKVVSGKSDLKALLRTAAEQGPGDRGAIVYSKEAYILPGENGKPQAKIITDLSDNEWDYVIDNNIKPRLIGGNQAVGDEGNIYGLKSPKYRVAGVDPAKVNVWINDNGSYRPYLGANEMDLGDGQRYSPLIAQSNGEQQRVRPIAESDLAYLPADDPEPYLKSLTNWNPDASISSGAGKFRQKDLAGMQARMGDNYTTADGGDLLGSNRDDLFRAIAGLDVNQNLVHPGGLAFDQIYDNYLTKQSNTRKLNKEDQGTKGLIIPVTSSHPGFAGAEVDSTFAPAPSLKDRRTGELVEIQPSWVQAEPSQSGVGRAAEYVQHLLLQDEANLGRPLDPSEVLDRVSLAAKEYNAAPTDVLRVFKQEPSRHLSAVKTPAKASPVGWTSLPTDLGGADAARSFLKGMNRQAGLSIAELEALTLNNDLPRVYQALMPTALSMQPEFESRLKGMSVDEQVSTIAEGLVEGVRDLAIVRQKSPEILAGFAESGPGSFGLDPYLKTYARNWVVASNLKQPESSYVIPRHAFELLELERRDQQALDPTKKVTIEDVLARKIGGAKSPIEAALSLDRLVSESRSQKTDPNRYGTELANRIFELDDPDTASTRLVRSTQRDIPLAIATGSYFDPAAGRFDTRKMPTKEFVTEGLLNRPPEAQANGILLNAIKGIDNAIPSNRPPINNLEQDIKYLQQPGVRTALDVAAANFNLGYYGSEYTGRGRVIGLDPALGRTVLDTTEMRPAATYYVDVESNKENDGGIPFDRRDEQQADVVSAQFVPTAFDATSDEARALIDEAGDLDTVKPDELSSALERAAKQGALQQRGNATVVNGPVTDPNNQRILTSEPDVDPGGYDAAGPLAFKSLGPESPYAMTDGEAAEPLERLRRIQGRPPVPVKPSASSDRLTQALDSAIGLGMSTAPTSMTSSPKEHKRSFVIQPQRWNLAGQPIESEARETTITREPYDLNRGPLKSIGATLEEAILEGITRAGINEKLRRPGLAPRAEPSAGLVASAIQAARSRGRWS